MSETNKAKGSVLRKYIERVEDLRRQKKELSEEESLVWAECKSQGYAPGILKTIIKERSKRPADLEEEQALKDMYLDALGMKSEPPLFRAVGLMNVDPMARESVLAALSQIVPAQGDIILNMGGKPTRLWRGEDGEVLSEPWSPPVAAANSTENEPKSARLKPVPVNVSEEEAEEAGRKAYHENKPVISNPFPAGSPHRARCDKGWRDAAGNDGMGDD